MSKPRRETPPDRRGRSVGLPVFAQEVCGHGVALCPTCDGHLVGGGQERRCPRCRKTVTVLTWTGGVP